VRARFSLACAAAAALAAACSFDSPSFDGTRYACAAEEPRCPGDMVCVAGFCEPQSGVDPDAAPLPTDASPPADAPPPDADPADARVPMVLSFGERDGADIAGVTSDTFIGSDAPTLNHGTANDLQVESTPVEVALLRFDVSALPPGTVVISAELHLFTSLNDPLQEGSVQVYAMLEAWDEGAQSAAPGQANFDDRALATPWSAAGAAPPSRDGTVLADFAPSVGDVPYSVSLPPALVDAWRDPSQNFGIAMATENAGGAGVTFRSSQAGASTKRPLLVVTVL
jgi:hypothetical protein